MSRHSRNIVLRIVAAQVFIGISLAAVVYCIAGWHASYSALAGALTATVPSYYLVVRMFRSNANLSADDVLRNIYVAEAFKVGLTVAMFAIAIVVLSVDFTVLIGVYAAVVAVNWVGMRYADLGERRRQEFDGACG